MIENRTTINKNKDIKVYSKSRQHLVQLELSRKFLFFPRTLLKLNVNLKERHQEITKIN